MTASLYFTSIAGAFAIAAHRSFRPDVETHDRTARIASAPAEGNASIGRGAAYDLTKTGACSSRSCSGACSRPYVDPAAATAIVGQASFQKAALEAQEHSMVLLTNQKAILPERTARKIFLSGVDAKAATAAGLTVVPTAAEADFAIVRMSAPLQTLHPGYFFGSRQHEGDLDFKADDPQFGLFEKTAKLVPTVAAIYLDRPAILTPLVHDAAAVLVNFGTSDEALLAVITGKAKPEGKLPFELPRSMDAVRAQKSDVPHDSASPLFPIFAGLSYR